MVRHSPLPLSSCLLQTSSCAARSILAPRALLPSSPQARTRGSTPSPASSSTRIRSRGPRPPPPSARRRPPPPPRGTARRGPRPPPPRRAVARLLLAAEPRGADSPASSSPRRRPPPPPRGSARRGPRPPPPRRAVARLLLHAPNRYAHQATLLFRSCYAKPSTRTLKLSVFRSNFLQSLISSDSIIKGIPSSN